MTLIISRRFILWPGWDPVGQFIFKKYYKECQSELKKDYVTNFTKNDKVGLKMHDVFYIRTESMCNMPLNYRSFGVILNLFYMYTSTSSSVCS